MGAGKGQSERSQQPVDQAAEEVRASKPDASPAGHSEGDVVSDAGSDVAPARNPGGNPSGAGGAVDGSLREQLEAAQAERHANRENWLRTQAELENYRKRVQREMDEARRYQVLPLARDVLPVVDNLRRAIAVAEEGGDRTGLVDGIRLVLKQLEDTLSRHDVKPIEAAGQPFDPNLHEALQQVPSAEQPPMTVLQEYQRGYRLHDRVIRPSQVVVSKQPE
jgi:molecular chaperone GrpE